MKYNSEQEAFWAGEFGENYIKRNQSKELLASNINFFSKALHQTRGLNSCVEFGANIGMNLKALKMLYPNLSLSGVEINKLAAQELEKTIGAENVFQGSILDYSTENKKEISLIKGVLIHINPELLPAVYQKLYDASSGYILIAEYYNPSPVVINYRGHENRLFKRDFAGEMMEKFPDLKLLDYGFSYRKDPVFPQDDITWFLLKK